MKRIPKRKAEETETQAEKPHISPWWNSRERWEHELGIKPKHQL
jgi:hypothetical protein